MYNIFFLILASISLIKPLTASTDKAMEICQRFNNHCDVMSCAMSPLSADVINTFEKDFNQLEHEVLAGISIDLPSNRQKILDELAELKSSRDAEEAGFFSGDKLSRLLALEKELTDLESHISAKPPYKRAMDEIAIVRDRLRHLKVGLNPRAVLTVPGGIYKMGKKNDIAVTLRPFMVAQTHVTQGEWKQLANGENPSYFKGNYRPVEMISWGSMVMYTIKLNERLGLAQPLDLTQMDFLKFTGRWEDGTLNFKGEESKILVDLKKNGYRLPTEAEWEYLARNLGLSTSTYPHDLSESQLADYSVYSVNSGKQTADVKSKKPLPIDGREIYDLMGNIWIGTLDAYVSAPLGGDNPLQLSKSSDRDRVFRGGSWNINAGSLRSAGRDGVGVGKRGIDCGLRLVRTLP